MAKKTRIVLEDFEKIDAVRELEMAVDAFGDTNYTGQFMYDLRVYGIKEAKMYLLDFVKTKWGDKKHEQEVKFHEAVDAALKRMGRQE